MEKKNLVAQVVCFQIEFKGHEFNSLSEKCTLFLKKYVTFIGHQIECPVLLF